ncbi:hypothetical protein PPROV_000156800 [Pycnococcus provasolii]|uniref:EF-hand domain-containing protein n=1 Tax=Pycnococcus provasolii TaxID=41880 RepID=A0A830H8V6_9CHLO|nr:hypothetical protein PPROV_000156800 [Pycnococcus provasolii]|mmetsp:Transcript_4074/g.9106  ORF Transcript_4074/g.9106 Transcript_4074/m.9106 type:complete len:208 (-) Transcript_4074:86-709(-)
MAVRCCCRRFGMTHFGSIMGMGMWCVLFGVMMSSIFFHPHDDAGVVVSYSCATPSPSADNSISNDECAMNLKANDSDEPAESEEMDAMISEHERTAEDDNDLKLVDDVDDDIAELDAMLQEELAAADEQQKQAQAERENDAARERFNQLDENDDGVISVGELHAAVRASSPATTKQDVEGFLSMADANGDKYLTFEEYGKLIRAKRA